MNSIVFFIILGTAMWSMNIIFGLFQIKDFNKNYIEMRRSFKVAIGRRKGNLKAGTVVLIAIDNDGIIKEMRKMQGVTVIARVKKFQGLEGRKLDDIRENDLQSYNKLMRVAILDAINNYKVFKGGELEERNQEIKLATQN